MKKILNGLILLGVLAGTLHAECSKAEVMKLTVKGFNKSEIASICDIPLKSTATKTINNEKWITPKNSTCLDNGGEEGWFTDACQVNWNNAKAICRASGGRLPTIEELAQVISDCDGKLNNTKNALKKNIEDPNYQSCYKRKGFIVGSNDIHSDYWSSTTFTRSRDAAWYVYFKTGNFLYHIKEYNHYVRCIRIRQ